MAPTRRSSKASRDVTFPTSNDGYGAPPSESPSASGENQQSSFLEPSSSHCMEQSEATNDTAPYRPTGEELQAFYGQITQQLHEGKNEIHVTWDRPGPVPTLPPLHGKKLFIQRGEVKKIGRPTRPEVPVVKEDGEMPEFVNVVQKDSNDMMETYEKRKQNYTFLPKKFRNKSGVPYAQGTLKGYSWDGDIDNFANKKDETKNETTAESEAKTEDGGEKEEAPAPKPQKKSKALSASVAVNEQRNNELDSPAPPAKKKAVEWVPPWPVNPAHVVAKPRGANGTAVIVTAEVCQDVDQNRVQMVYETHEEDPTAEVEKPKRKRVRKPRPPGATPRTRKRKNQQNAEDTLAPTNQEYLPACATHVAAASVPFSHITSDVLSYEYETFTNAEVSIDSVNTFTNVRDVDLLTFITPIQRTIDYDEHGRQTLGALRRQMQQYVCDNPKLQRFGDLVEVYKNSAEKFDALVNPENEEYGGGPMAVATGRKTLNDMSLSEYSFQKLIFEVMGLQDEFKEKLSMNLEKTPIEDPYYVPYEKITLPAFITDDASTQTESTDAPSNEKKLNFKEDVDEPDKPERQNVVKESSCVLEHTAKDIKKEIKEEEEFWEKRTMPGKFWFRIAGSTLLRAPTSSSILGETSQTAQGEKVSRQVEENAQQFKCAEAKVEIPFQEASPARVEENLSTREITMEAPISSQKNSNSIIIVNVEYGHTERLAGRFKSTLKSCDRSHSSASLKFAQ